MEVLKPTKRPGMVICPDSEAQLQTLRLPATQVDQAFGILLIKGTPITLAMWRSYAQGRIKAASSTTGIISIQCDRAFIHGLFGYEIGPVGVNQCMIIDLFITSDQIGDCIARTMIGAAEDVASGQACSVIHLCPQKFCAAKTITLDPRSLAAMSESGYAIELIQLSKTLQVQTAKSYSPRWLQ